MSMGLERGIGTGTREGRGTEMATRMVIQAEMGKGMKKNWDGNGNRNENWNGNENSNRNQNTNLSVVWNLIPVAKIGKRLLVHSFAASSNRTTHDFITSKIVYLPTKWERVS